MNSNLKKLALGAALAGAALLPPRAAQASSPYLEVMQQDYGWCGQCELCHATPAGGGAATQAFAMALKDLSPPLTGGANVDGLKSLLMTAEAQAVDADDDGKPDLTEMEAGGDPNLGDIQCSTYEGVQPEYGCAATISPVEDSDSRVSWLGALAIGAALLVRRRGVLGRFGTGVRS